MLDDRRKIFLLSGSEFMLRQGIRRVVVWLFEKRDLQNVRNVLSRVFLPFWPSYEFAKLRNGGTIGQPGSHFQQADGRWKLETIRATLDINPGSGEAFFHGRRPRPDAAATPEAGPVDLLCHIFPIKLRRKEALVLHRNGFSGFNAFVGELLPRFFALDDFGLSNDLLLLVGLEMAKQRYFQDALIDQVFRPRPMEILRQFHLVTVDTLHLLQVPAWDPELIQRASRRFEMIYGPFVPCDRPVLLCTGGAARASRLARRFRGRVPHFFDQSYSVLDPSRLPLRDVLKAIARAPMVAAPTTGEAALLGLVPSAQRTLCELQIIEAPRTVPAELLDAANGERQVFRLR